MANTTKGPSVRDQVKRQAQSAAFQKASESAEASEAFCRKCRLGWRYKKACDWCLEFSVDGGYADVADRLEAERVGKLVSK